MEPGSPASAAPVALFYSYAHEDEPLRDELQGHLKLLERRGLLAPWHDRQIVPGADWAAAIDANLQGAELVLLLLSKDFIESDYIMGVELAAAMKRHAEQAATVVPIMLRAFDLEPEDVEALPFLKLQGLPTDLKPVTSWANRDEAWTNVAKGLRQAVKAIRERRPPPPPAPPPFAPAHAASEPAPRSRSASPPARAPSGLHAEEVTGDLQDLGYAVERGEPPVAADPLLERLIADVAQQIAAAQHERGAPPLDQRAVAAVRNECRTLIDLREQKRVLWVDDQPEGNRFEAAALAKLQIEIVTALDTESALRILREDEEGFDLVISDWERAGESEEAGLQLLARMRDAGTRAPLVYYHGATGGQRARRAAQARSAGALGEAVLPDELMALVVQALQAAPPPG